MVAPAAAVAAGWTISEIAAGIGIVGTVGGGIGSAAASGTSGWNYQGPTSNLLYPKEIGTELFLGDGDNAAGTLIRFFADGYIWNNECFVRFNGLFSNASDPAQCYANGNYPTIPANRFIEVGFTKGGEELGSGLLTCGLSSFAHVEGSAEDPYMILHAAGHFDPVGAGDAEYGFTIYLSTFGTVSLGPIDVQTGGVKITEDSGHVSVYLDQ